MRKKPRVKRDIDFVALELSDVELKKKLFKIGQQLKATRIQTQNNAPYSYYEKGANMCLSTFLRLLAKYNVSPADFFREINE
jgi:hypothetical protein